MMIPRMGGRKNCIELLRTEIKLHVRYSEIIDYGYGLLRTCCKD